METELMLFFCFVKRKTPKNWTANKVFEATCFLDAC